MMPVTHGVMRTIPHVTIISQEHLTKPLVLLQGDTLPLEFKHWDFPLGSEHLKTTLCIC